MHRCTGDATSGRDRNGPPNGERQLDHRLASAAGAAATWVADAIRPLADRGTGTEATFVTKTFKLPSVNGREVLRITAFGLYRAFINGQRVGNDLLTPGWTSYERRLAFQSYAVSDLLRTGSNTIEIWLADGWFRSRLMWTQSARENAWGSHVAAIAEVRAGPSETARVLVRTDATWESGTLPILKSGIYFGETYDARRAQAVSAGCAVMPFDRAVLVAQETAPVRELAPLRPVLTWTDGAGRTVYDFGQNTAGYVAFTVDGEAGAEVVVEHSEIVDKDNGFDNRNYRSAEARIEYRLRGGGEERYRPAFTFQGFRYARVTVSGRARITDIQSVPISSLPHPSAGFSSGHPLVNRLVENTLWSQRSNFIEVPTDCPQRDERLGWTGDAQVFAAAACYLHDCESFFLKYVRDMIADQRSDGAIAHFVPNPTKLRPSAAENFYGSTGWGDAIAVIPWTLYLHYGNRSVLAEALPAMVRWVDFVWSISGGPIVRPPRARNQRGFTFGDWLQPKGTSEKPLPTISDDCAATIYLYISSMLAAKAARALGDRDVEALMSARAEDVKAAFVREFITPAGRIGGDDQTSYALAILFDLVPPALLVAAGDNFKAAIARCGGRIGTGFIGTPALLPALMKIGAASLAATVFLQEEVPGWLYQVKNGATTIWERWDAIGPDGSVYAPEMNSYNHYAYGAVCRWLFESVAGFRPDEDEPGFSSIHFEPTIIPQLSPVSAHYDSRAGRIEAGWRLEGDKVTYTLSVPDGAKGTLHLGSGYRDVVVDGRPLSPPPANERLRHALDAGSHTVTFRVAGGGLEDAAR